MMIKILATFKTRDRAQPKIFANCSTKDITSAALLFGTDVSTYSPSPI